MIVTIFTLSSFCLPQCYPGFSCFHSLGENTHLASNQYHSSLVDSKIAILFYSTPFPKSCSEQSCFLTYCESPSPRCNHNFSCLQLSLHCFLIFVPFRLFFILLITSHICSVFPSHTDAHTHRYQFTLILSNPTSSKTLFMISFLPSHRFQLNFKHNLLP